MHLIGAAHPNKHRTIAVLTRLARDGEMLVTDVEAYQEILHRCVAIGRLEAIDAAAAVLDDFVASAGSFVATPPCGVPMLNRCQRSGTKQCVDSLPLLAAERWLPWLSWL